MRRWVELSPRATVHWQSPREVRPPNGGPGRWPPLDMTMGTRPGFPTADPLSAFSALHLLRNYNQFLLPPGSNLVQICHNYPSIGDLPQEDLPRSTNFPFSPAGAFHPYPNYPLPTSPDLKSRSPFLTSTVYGRRPRGEKKPIPDDQKDDRYYERRKRNNQAAKKSRDARKLREDQVNLWKPFLRRRSSSWKIKIALRATLLEHENAILRAQLLTLREETESLRQLILRKKEFPGPNLDLGTETDLKFPIKDVNKIVD